MNKKITSAIKMSIGLTLTVLAVLLLYKFVKVIDLDLEFFLESIVSLYESSMYLILGLSLGVCGMSIFLNELMIYEERISNK